MRGSVFWQLALLDHFELVRAQSAEDCALDGEGVLLPRELRPEPGEWLQTILSAADNEHALSRSMQETVLMHDDPMKGR